MDPIPLLKQSKPAMHIWSVRLCGFRQSFILNSLLLLVKLLQLCSLLTPPCFATRKPSFTRFLRPGFCHLSAPSKPFVDAYITHDLASELCYSKRSCILVLICLEKSVWWCCFYLHALAHERFTLEGMLQFPITEKGWCMYACHTLHTLGD